MSRASRLHRDKEGYIKIDHYYFFLLICFYKANMERKTLKEWFRLVLAHIDEPKFGKSFHEKYQAVGPLEGTMTYQDLDYEVFLLWSEILHRIHAKRARLQARQAASRQDDKEGKPRTFGNTINRMKWDMQLDMRDGWMRHVSWPYIHALLDLMEHQYPRIKDFTSISVFMQNVAGIDNASDTLEYQRLVVAEVHSLIGNDTTKFYPTLIEYWMPALLQNYIRLFGFTRMLIANGIHELVASYATAQFENNPELKAAVADELFGLLKLEPQEFSMELRKRFLTEPPVIDPVIEAAFADRCKTSSKVAEKLGADFSWVFRGYYQWRLEKNLITREEITQKTTWNLIKAHPQEDTVSRLYHPPDRIIHQYL